MKKKTALATAAFLITSLSGYLAPSTAVAASEDECAIWLCLPGGFPSGCSKAHSAMIDRVKALKSPLPAFSSCVVQSDTAGGSQMSSNDGIAAYVPNQRVCTKQVYVGDRLQCQQWRNESAQFLRGRRCIIDRDGIRSPRNCTGTYRYVDVFIDGEKAGDTYYFK